MCKSYTYILNMEDIITLCSITFSIFSYIFLNKRQKFTLYVVLTKLNQEIRADIKKTNDNIIIESNIIEGWAIILYAPLHGKE